MCSPLCERKCACSAGFIPGSTKERRKWCSRDDADTHHRMQLVGLEHSHAVFVLVSDRRQAKGKGKGKGQESKGKGKGSDGHGPSGSGGRDGGDGRIVPYRPY